MRRTKWSYKMRHTKSSYNTCHTPYVVRDTLCRVFDLHVIRPLCAAQRLSDPTYAMQNRCAVCIPTVVLHVPKADARRLRTTWRGHVLWCGSLLIFYSIFWVSYKERMDLECAPITVCVCDVFSHQRTAIDCALAAHDPKLFVSDSHRECCPSPALLLSLCECKIPPETVLLLPMIRDYLWLICTEIAALLNCLWLIRSLPFIICDWFTLRVLPFS